VVLTTHLYECCESAVLLTAHLYECCDRAVVLTTHLYECCDQALVLTTHLANFFMYAVVPMIFVTIVWFLQYSCFGYTVVN